MMIEINPRTSKVVAHVPSNCQGCAFNGGAACNRYVPARPIQDEATTGTCGPTRLYYVPEDDLCAGAAA